MWSSQQYRETGRELQIDGGLIERAAVAIERFIDGDPKLPPLITLGHLARRTEVIWFYLNQLVSGSRENAYTSFWIRKRSGGYRLISVPEPNLMAVQRWIASHILAHLPVHRASFAFARHSSIKRCAAQHCGAQWLIKLDISGFFGSISEVQVYRVFLEAGYVPLVAFELARLCTRAPSKSKRYTRPEWQAYRYSRPVSEYRQMGIGYLPQGAPTSPMLSNLVMKDVDRDISSMAAKAGLTYTRYSDDMTFSSRGAFSRSQAIALIRVVTARLRRIGLSVNDRKTRIVPPGARKVVLGLLVDGNAPCLTREFRDQLRQHLYYLERLGPEAHRAKRNFDTVGGMYRHIRGLIDFAKSVDETYAAKMRTKFDNIAWSPDLAPNIG